MQGWCRIRWVMLCVFILFLDACRSSVGDSHKEVADMRVSSAAFQEGGAIPEEFTCDGADVSPPLRIENAPTGTKSLALTVEDPDAPSGTFVHWVVWNLSSGTRDLPKGQAGGVAGRNDFGRKGYGGPCPPSGQHRYFFKAYAVDTMLALSSDSGKKELEKALKGHILAEARLMGIYQR